MKNNCDVSGWQPICKAHHAACDHYRIEPHLDIGVIYCAHFVRPFCVCLAAIRAAIEAEKETELAALKKDALICAEFVDADGNETEDEHAAAIRIMKRCGMLKE